MHGPSFEYLPSKNNYDWLIVYLSGINLKICTVYIIFLLFPNVNNMTINYNNNPHILPVPVS
jgi:succinate dehydrogenase hydrophobic anchor subunit